MVKELSEMTIEELWELFPIILKEYNLDYKKWYECEKEQLMAIFHDFPLVRINHIGSTAVPGILSKPIVDILMEISPQSDIEYVEKILKSNQWILMNASQAPIFKQVYNKGYTKYGFAEKVYHLHVRYVDDWSELYFRDYLIEYPEVAKEYTNLKISLKEIYEHDRDGYTKAKEEFVNKYSERAKGCYAKRYKIDVVK